MWPAIPIALLCMFANLRRGSRAAAPKETKSCRLQEDFRLIVHPHDLGAERADLKPERAY